MAIGCFRAGVRVVSGLRGSLAWPMHLSLLASHLSTGACCFQALLHTRIFTAVIPSTPAKLYFALSTDCGPCYI